MKVIDVSKLYESDGTAKLSQITDYTEKALALAGEGNNIVLTGPGPVWLYLLIAHALHGRVKSLLYSSPVTGDVIIFDHNPF